jgi:hypothetical protein
VRDEASTPPFPTLSDTHKTFVFSFGIGVFLARYALRNSVGADGSIHETVGMRQSGAGIISKYVEESGVVRGVITK